MARATKLTDVEITGDLTVGGSITGASGSAKEISFVIGAGTDLSINDTIAVPRIVTTATAGTLTKLYAKAGTGPTGSALSILLKIGGVTTATVTISAGQTAGTTTSFSDATLAENDILTIVVSAVGSSVPGKDVHVVAVVS